jgi:mono/diheme cytochrome c family protein
MTLRPLVIAASMWSVLTAGHVVSLSAQNPTPGQDETAAPTSVPNQRELLDTYCVTCHNSKTEAGGVALDKPDPARVGEDPELWERVVRKLRSGTMPPQGVRRPEPAALSAFVGHLESELDHRAAAAPNPGRPVLRRLNRAEYANAIRDLLTLDVDVAALLPPDDSGYGFDNIGDVLTVTPALLDRYLAAADRISSLAVGDTDIGPGAEIYKARHDLSQDQHIEGLPLGTNGGMLVRHTFPLDGEYLIQVKLFRSNIESVRGLESENQLEILLDGERVKVASVGGDEDFAAAVENPTLAGDAVDARLQTRVTVKAGPRNVGVTFVQKRGEGTRRLQPFLRSSADTFDSTGRPHVERLTITGPFKPGGAGETPARKRIFVCRPSDPSAEGVCAWRIMSTLARRAYRRTPTSEEIDGLMAFYANGRKKGSFDTGIQMALRRMLASPKFVLRPERDGSAPGSPYPVTGDELASRLSFFLWSSIPDDELLTVGGAGRLTDRTILVRQVRRMLADPKAEALVANFAGQWLQLRNLRRVVPNSNEFPDFDDNLRQSMRRETELFFQSIIHEDRSLLDLLTADYTFVNERLARHYGIPNVYGSHFRRVTLTDDARRGLLGKGAVLTVTSHVDRTSPVVRGKWLLENILGTPPPPPPAVVPPLPETQPGEKPRTMRAQMEAHRQNPACASCHKLMDPLGFALENFDAVGAWRMVDAGSPIDASGQLADGTKVDGVVTLRQALVSRADVFVQTFVEKLLTYALGRGLTADDMPVVRAIVRQAAANNYRFSTIVQGVVTSAPFQMRMNAGPSERGRVAVAESRQPAQ